MFFLFRRMDVAGLLLRKKVFGYLADHAHITYVDAVAPMAQEEPAGGADSVTNFSNLNVFMNSEEGDVNGSGEGNYSSDRNSEGGVDNDEITSTGGSDRDDDGDVDDDSGDDRGDTDSYEGGDKDGYGSSDHDLIGFENRMDAGDRENVIDAEVV